MQPAFSHARLKKGDAYRKRNQRLSDKEVSFMLMTTCVFYDVNRRDVKKLRVTAAMKQDIITRFQKSTKRGSPVQPKSQSLRVLRTTVSRHQNGQTEPWRNCKPRSQWTKQRKPQERARMKFPQTPSPTKKRQWIVPKLYLVESLNRTSERLLHPNTNPLQHRTFQRIHGKTLCFSFKTRCKCTVTWFEITTKTTVTSRSWRKSRPSLWVSGYAWSRHGKDQFSTSLWRSGQNSS